MASLETTVKEYIKKKYDIESKERNIKCVVAHMKKARQ